MVPLGLSLVPELSPHNPRLVLVLVTDQLLLVLVEQLGEDATYTCVPARVERHKHQ